MSETRAELAYKARIGNAKVDAVDAKCLKRLHHQLWEAIECPHWSAPLPRPPGIYWRRTGGKTHTVEVVR